MTQLVLFDDGHGQWGPVNDLRSIMDVRSAGLTMRERIESVTGLEAASLRTPDHLRGLTLGTQQSDQPGNDLDAIAGGSDLLLINARWLAVDHVQKVKNLPSQTALCDREGALVAINTSDVTYADKLLSTNITPKPGDGAFLKKRYELPNGFDIELIDGRPLVSRPWQLLDRLDDTLLYDICHSPIGALDDGISGVTISRQHDVYIDPTVKFHPCAVIDTSAGPVHIGAHTEVGAMSVIEGPCYVGESCQITPHTRLRPWTAFGPHCVLGGEISRSIIQGYSNKAHAGYLGNSWVGRWVNLGADTNVSNLKNTYGNVRMKLDHAGESQDTGLMKQGPLIGDFCRTAIGTRLMTGSCIATGTMLAVSGFAPKSTRRFSFITDQGEQPYEIERFLDSARLAMSRRRIQMDEALEARLRDLSNSDW